MNSFAVLVLRRAALVLAALVQPFICSAYDVEGDPNIEVEVTTAGTYTGYVKTWQNSRSQRTRETHIYRIRVPYGKRAVATLQYTDVDFSNDDYSTRGWALTLNATRVPNGKGRGIYDETLYSDSNAIVEGWSYGGSCAQTVYYELSVRYIDLKPDLTTSNSSSQFISIDEPLKLKFYVKNSGNKSAEPSIAKVYNGKGSLLKTISVGALSVGATEFKEITLSGLTVGSNQTFRVVADANNDVEESNEYNNQTTISLNVYKKVLRDVRFHSNGGKGAMPNQRVVCGTTTALIENQFVREDYVFSGWATTPSGGVVYKDEANVLTYYDNVDLYAVWSVKTCNVTFKSEDEEIDVRSYSIISPCGTSLPVATKKNCDFIGWFTEPNGGVQITSNTIFKADSTVYARFSEPMVTLTYHSGTGETVEYRIPVGESKLPPNPFVREGYKFVGWHSTKDVEEINFEVYEGAICVRGVVVECEDEQLYKFIEDVTFYPVWSKIWTCHFGSNGGSGYMHDIAVSASDYVEPECKYSKDGETFMGWNVSRSDEDGVLLHIAEWGRELVIKNGFTGGVRFVTEHDHPWKIVGENLRSAEITGDEKSRISLLFPREKGVYYHLVRYRGRYNEATTSLYRRPELEFRMGLHNSTRKIYNVGQQNSSGTMSNGFHFEGNGVRSFIDFSNDGGYIFHRRWGYTASNILNMNRVENYRAYNRNYYDAEAESSGTFALIYPSVFIQQEYNLTASGTVTNMVVSAKEEWELREMSDWISVEKDSSNPYKGIVTIEPNNSIEPRTGKLCVYNGVHGLVTITINQASSVPSINVFFDANGGTVVTNRKWYAAGVQLGSLPTPSRDCYLFSGWYTQREGGRQVKVSSTLSENSTLYAHWTKKKYSVQFDGNGYSAAVSSRQVEFGSPIGTLPSLKRSGCDFVGWATKPEGGILISGDSTVSSNIKLYARWLDRRFTIVLHKNDGSGTIYEKKIEYGKSTALPGAVADLSWAPRRGFSFMGWSTAEKSKTVWKKDKAVLSKTVSAGETFHAYAIWQLKTNTAYAIQYIRNDGSGSVRTIGFNGGVATKLNSIKALGFERRGYTFVGWATSTADARAKKVWKKDMGVVSQPVANGKLLQIYAIWKLTPGYYSIRFNKNDGTGKWRELGYKYGDNTTLPTIANGLQWSRAGYRFGGWATSAANAAKGIVWRGDKGVTRTPVAAGKTLNVYAIWKKVGAAATAVNRTFAQSTADLSSLPSFGAAESARLLPGYYSGELADGTGTYDLIVDESGETGYVHILFDDGSAVFGEVNVDIIGDIILVVNKNGELCQLRYNKVCVDDVVVQDCLLEVDD